MNDFLAAAARGKLLSSAHDCAEGGLAVALAEGCLFGGFGAELAWEPEVSPAAALFGESQSRVLLSLPEKNLAAVESLARQYDLPTTVLGRVGGDAFRLKLGSDSVEAPVAELAAIHRDSLAALATLSMNEAE